eukprot:scaffold7349_cov383-Pinguiococcus_pyrenoidosus.AAC.5
MFINPSRSCRLQIPQRGPFVHGVPVMPFICSTQVRNTRRNYADATPMGLTNSTRNFPDRRQRSIRGAPKARHGSPEIDMVMETAVRRMRGLATKDALKPRHQCPDRQLAHFPSHTLLQTPTFYQRHSSKLDGSAACASLEAPRSRRSADLNRQSQH